MSSCSASERLNHALWWAQRGSERRAPAALLSAPAEALDRLRHAAVSRASEAARGAVLAVRSIAALMDRPTMPSTLPLALASVTLAGLGGRRPGPVVGDVALQPEFIRSRLQALSVYTVVNADSEFVLVSGGDADGDAGGDGDAAEGPGRQLGLFFFRQKDAEAVVESIAEASPSLARTTKIIKVSLDRVYDFLNSSEAAQLSDVGFRLVPDYQEVSNALGMSVSEGAVAEDHFASFIGVPVFQAEGLSVKQGGSKYYPLFLSRHDLDVAVGSAQDRRLLNNIAAQEVRVREIKDDVDKLAGDLRRAKNDRQKNRFSIKLEKAEAKQKKAEKRLRDMRARLSPPKVEVGSLEDVLKRMEEDSSGDWSSVMFVPAGQLGGKRGDRGAEALGL